MNMRMLQMLAALWVPLVAVLVGAAVLIDAGDGWPVAGSAVVVGAGVVVLVVIGWLRQRPVAPGDEATYRSTVLVRLALVEAIGLVGFSLAVAVGPWWLAVVGGLLSLGGLRMAWPSASDRERHELLYLV